MTLKTLNLLKKIITKGAYIKEELTSDINCFLELKTLTEEESIEILALMELNPAKEVILNSASENIYLLLKKQIENQAYSAEEIQNKVTDFRVTQSINAYQFSDLIADIKEKYFPYEADVLPELNDPVI